MQANHDHREPGPAPEATGLRKRVNRFALVVGFFVLLLLPTLFFGHPGTTNQAVRENRRLAEFPRASLFFFQNLEKWYTDHFGGRTTLIYYGARWQMDWIGLPGNRNVVLGQDNWLFYDQHYKPGQALFADFLGKTRFSDGQLQRIRDNLLRTHRSLTACGIGFYLVMPPDKQTIYADKMPFSRPPQTKTRADQLFDALRTAPELHAIDLRPALHAAREAETLPLYLKTDTHWNALGAYHGVRALLQSMDTSGRPGVPATPRQAYELASAPYPGGDIAVSLLSLPNYFDDAQLNMTLPGDTAKAIDAAQRHYRNPARAGRLLLYGDSFSELMLPLLAQHFGEVTGLPRAQIDAQDLQIHRPDVVVLEVLERLLGALEAGPLNLPHCPAAS
jgi:alginate O-acetyltransferase complex protein AlgJ